jgi:hypothetical protein
MGGLARPARYRDDPQSLPQFAQRPQSRGFGQFSPQLFSRLGGRQRPFRIENLPYLQHERRDLVPGTPLRRMLPVRVSPQGDHKGQRLARDQKVRLFPHGTQKVQGHRASGAGQPRQQVSRALDRRHIRRALAAPHTGFDKRGRWRRQLHVPRQIKAQGMLL